MNLECTWTGSLEELIVKALSVFLEEPTDHELKSSSSSFI